MTERGISVGVIGCGEIAQVMHLPVLHELHEFTIGGLCDLSARTLEYLGGRYGVRRRTTDYRELVEAREIEAVVICTYDHTPVVEAALAAGKHVLVEKPLAFTPAEGDRLVAAAAEAGTVAQVGYMKLHDPALARARELYGAMTGIRSLGCHDFAGSFAQHGRLYTQFRGDDVDPALLAAGRDAVTERIREMLGADHAAYEQLYTLLLMLGSHDLAVMRSLFGAPERVAYAQARGDEQLLAVLDFPGEVPCVLEVGVGTSYQWWDEWVSVHGEAVELRLEFPNPYVRYAPSVLRLRSGDGDSPSERLTPVSHESPFRLQWLHFADCVGGRADPVSTLAGATADLRLAREIISAMAARPASVGA